MRTKGRKVLTGVGMVLAASVACAVTPPPKAAEYSVIQVRNPLGLVDPPPPAKPAEPEKKVEVDPPPNVELTGLFRSSRRGGKIVAMFLVEKKKGGPKDSYMWSVGDGDDGMKVLAINEADKTVKLSVQNVESTITFSERKVAAAPVAAGPGAPGGPAGAAGAANRRAAVAANAQGTRQIESVRNGGFNRSVASRSAVGGGNRTQNAPQTAQGQYNNMSPRTIRAPSSQQGQQQVEVLTPQEQEVLIEVNREVLKQTGQINLMPPLPPTSLTTPQDRQLIVVPPSPTTYPQR